MTLEEIKNAIIELSNKVAKYSITPGMVANLLEEIRLKLKEGFEEIKKSDGAFLFAEIVISKIDNKIRFKKNNGGIMEVSLPIASTDNAGIVTAEKAKQIEKIPDIARNLKDLSADIDAPVLSHFYDYSKINIYDDEGLYAVILPVAKSNDIKGALYQYQDEWRIVSEKFNIAGLHWRQVLSSIDEKSSPTGGGINDAPLDGKTYARRNGVWKVVSGTEPFDAEILNIEINKWEGLNKIVFSGAKVYITIDGETSTYITDENGKISTSITRGSIYSVEVEPIKGMYLYSNVYKWNYVANAPIRTLVVNYRDVKVGIYFVTKDGAEYTKKEWNERSEDVVESDVVALKISTFSLAASGNQFGISIADIASGVYLKTTRQLCTVISIGGYNSGLSSEGLKKTIILMNDSGHSYPAVNYCFNSMLTIGGSEVQGFMGGTFQYLEIANNIDLLNEMLRMVLPDAVCDFSDFNGFGIWCVDRADSQRTYVVMKGSYTSQVVNTKYYSLTLFAI